MTDERQGPKGATGERGPAGPPGEPGHDAPVPEEEQIPLGYRHIAAFLKAHPSFKRPSTVTIVLFMVLVFGAGFLHFSDAAATRKVEQAHNASACTFRVFLSGLKSRAEKAAVDMTTSKSARDRAEQSLPQYQTLIDGQVTQPKTLDCPKLLKKLADQNKASASEGIQSNAGQ